MKKIYILFVLLLSIFTKVNAQEITVNLNVDSNPNPEISEWVDRTELAILTIVNTNERFVDLEYKIVTKIYKDGELVVETKTSQMPIMYLPFGSETFLADEIVPYNALTFYGNIEKTITQTGLLPAGMYSFCVSLVDLKGNLLTKQESICKPMVITDYQLPELIYPIENTTILAQNLPSTLFTWSPIAPTPPGDEGIKYIIAITEVLQKQTPARAFDVNYPLVEEEIMAGTQFNWPTDIDIPDEDTQYVWSIKPVTYNDNPYKSGKNSFVKIGTFNVKTNNRSSENGEDDKIATGNSENTTTKNSKQNESCECLNGDNIDVSFLPINLYTNTSGKTIIEVSGLLTLQNMIRACMSDVQLQLSPWELQKYDFPNWQFHIRIGYDATHTPIFDSSVGAGDTSSHVYDTHALQMACVKTEQLQIEVTVINKQLDFNCTMVFFKDIPEEFLNTIYGEKENCNCEENLISEPTVLITQSDAETDPLKMQLVNYETYKNYVLGCANNPDDFTVNAAINWGDGTPLTYSASPNTEHTYTSIDDMPASVELLFELKP
ncbi:hypothetical protein, partial [Lutibacter sp.]